MVKVRERLLSWLSFKKHQIWLEEKSAKQQQYTWRIPIMHIPASSQCPVCYSSTARGEVGHKLDSNVLCFPLCLPPCYSFCAVWGCRTSWIGKGIAGERDPGSSCIPLDIKHMNSVCAYFVGDSVWSKACNAAQKWLTVNPFTHPFRSGVDKWKTGAQPAFNMPTPSSRVPQH